MSNLEHQLLDELYFTIAFDELLSRFDANLRSVMRTELERLVRQGLVSQMVYHSTKNDFEKLDALDSQRIDSSYFVATRRGLMAHNSR